MLDRQDVFNRVARHLLTQKVRAFFGDSCRYRTPTGEKCAIGALLKDEFYNEEFEGCTVGSNDRRGHLLRDALRKSGFDINDDAGDSYFLLRLQRLHDYPENEGAWKQALTRFAAEDGLDILDLLAEEKEAE